VQFTGESRDDVQRWRSLWSVAEPDGLGGADAFELIQEIKRHGIFFTMWPGPNWNKLFWIAGGIAAIFVLGLVTMWMRGQFSSL